MPEPMYSIRQGSTRTTERTVIFKKPFVLTGFDEVLPAGAYSVEAHEEPLEGVSFPAYRRVLTQIRLRARPGQPRVTQVLTVDPNDLDAVWMRDLAPADIAGTDAKCEPLNGTTDVRREEADRPATERGEDERIKARHGRTIAPREP
jgi:hypothetical protein